MTKIITDTSIAAKEIIDGNVVGLPTETVYGLGANALDENAVLEIYETKDRPKFNPIIVHVYDIGEFEKYASEIPMAVYKLAEKFSPGPVTFVLKKRNSIPDIVTAGNDSVGLRIPSHPVFREVLKLSGLPIAAPSANRSGRISPTSAKDVLSELGGKISFILDGGTCSIGIESTVIDFTDGEIKILRHGFITKEDIESITGKVASAKTDRIVSPGLLKSHYAPLTPLVILNEPDALAENSDNRTGVLDFSRYKDHKEIALNLFSDLRKLDKLNFEKIICRKVEDCGLGIAINDRLERASLSDS